MIKVTSKSVLQVENELGKTILDVLKPATEGQGLPIKTVVSLLKASTGKTEDECLDMIENECGLIIKALEAYSGWVSKAFGVAEAGN